MKKRPPCPRPPGEPTRAEARRHGEPEAEDFLEAEGYNLATGQAFRKRVTRGESDDPQRSVAVEKILAAWRPGSRLAATKERPDHPVTVGA